LKCHDLIYGWFDHLKSNGHYVCGYVIMPNHVHLLLAFRNTSKSINTIIGNAKRLMAYEIVERLKKAGEYQVLEQLERSVNKSEAMRGKRHEVWQPSFDWKECDSEKWICQKLDYMHENSCKGVWHLAQSPFEYEHSSARFYICESHAGYAVTHYQELDDIDLTK